MRVSGLVDTSSGGTMTRPAALSFHCTDLPMLVTEHLCSSLRKVGGGPGTRGVTGRSLLALIPFSCVAQVGRTPKCVHCKPPPNQRMKLPARGRRFGRYAQWRLSILIAPAAGCSLCAIR